MSDILKEADKILKEKCDEIETSADISTGIDGISRTDLEAWANVFIKNKNKVVVESKFSRWQRFKKIFGLGK